MNYTKLTLKEIADKIKNKEIKITELVNEVISNIEKEDDTIGAFVSLNKEQAMKRAKELEEKLENEDVSNMPLFGVPVAIKDNINMRDTKTTCSSKMLENYVSPYDATVTEKLEEAGAIIIGKTNMDEFAMGGSTETSYFKKTKNPRNLERVPGGSSGGSAAAVAADMVYASLGTDTGGSIRQPASYCGIVGLKPTYGLVSRYGVVAFASSLDQVGPLTKTVEDSAIMLNAITGHDEKDSTSCKVEKIDYTKALKNNVKGIKIGVPTELLKDLKPEVKKATENAIEVLKNQGAEIVEINLDYAKYSLAVYYIIATAEASSNLARYDGIRYGHRTEHFEDTNELFKKSRTEGFGDEVKRRILLGTYVLSSGYFDAYYKKAQKVRSLIIDEFNRNFEKVDTIIIPTTMGAAFKFNAHSKSPLEMYLEDMFTVPVNIAGLPGISVPSGLDEDNMPLGVQFIAKAFNEETLLNVAYTYEQNRKLEK